jgi:hypothetical protein
LDVSHKLLSTEHWVLTCCLVLQLCSNCRNLEGHRVPKWFQSVALIDWLTGSGGW